MTASEDKQFADEGLLKLNTMNKGTFWDAVRTQS